MIFVTVGTHEQPFDRLIKYMDEWAGKNDEKVVIQTGYSSYKPKNCQWSKMFSHRQMMELMEKARIVITHGGPGSFLAVLRKGKIPIVVPRRKKYNEHINDHQLEFCSLISTRYKSIILVEDISELGSQISSYENLISEMNGQEESNNIKFCRNFEIIINDLMKD